jgi:hypothetical protein
MGKSTQLSLKYQDADNFSISPAVDFRDDQVVHESHGSTSSDLPSVDNWPSSYAHAQNARIAGRLNAASATEEELKALLAERRKLLDKKLSGDITRKESNRLEYVRWSLDRIEDARHGPTLDLLESAVFRYESIAEEIRSLRAALAEAAKRHS